MDYNYESSSKSANPTWTFSTGVINLNPDWVLNLYVYSGGENQSWNDETEFTTPPGDRTLRSVTTVGAGARRVNIPNLEEGQFVIVEITCPSCKQSVRYYASRRAGSGKSGKIIITS